MSYARDQLYNTYIRRNLPTIASRVKALEVIVHLPCLTSHDRENIQAKRDTNGNHDAMVLLMECLIRRENWPEQLIHALEACEHSTMAAEVRAAYEAWTGVNNSSASSPPSTVVRAHPAPAASPRPVPYGGAAVAPPPEVPPVSAEPAIQTPSPLQNTPEPPPSEVRLSTRAEVPPTVTPPPSPETPHAQPPAAAPLGDMQRVPEENSESQFDVDDNANPQNMEEAAPQSPGSRNDDSTATPTANQEQPRAAQGPSVLTVTPVKRPVQDSSPPAVQTPTAKVSQAVQAVDRSPQTERAASSSPSARRTPPLDDMCLSKPGQLVSIPPQRHPGPAVLPGSLEDPYSGGSDRLEISEAPPGAAPSQTSACSSAISSTSGGSVVEPPCQENGIAPDLHEPEETHHESLCPSMEVLENTVLVSQEPSILNLNGPPPHMKETGKGVASAADEAISASENSDPPKAKVPAELHPQQKAEPPQAPSPLTAPGGYVLAAAGVCACALLVAWKLKKM